MFRRTLLWIPVFLLFTGTSLVFLAAHAPRTWAAHWSDPRRVASGAGESEYGATYRDYGWDIAWVDDDRQTLVLTRRLGKHKNRTVVLDHGDVTEPTLLTLAGAEIVAWVHNYNGSTDLMGAIISPRSRTRIFRLAGGPWPLEHPYLFAGPHGVADLVFSWQRDGNFDIFLLSMPVHRARPTFIRRLTHSSIYAFYPRAVLDRHDHIFMLYLDACCQTHRWLVKLAQMTATGNPINHGRILSVLSSPSAQNSTPEQWAEDIRMDPAGHIWGAYAGDTGIWVFKLSGTNTANVQSRSLDPFGGIPQSLSLVPGVGHTYLFWEQPFDLGTYLAGQRIDSDMRSITRTERVVYEAAGQTGIHAVLHRGTVRVLWQSITPGLRSTFETATSTRSRTPDLAQRFGLGLGNPLEALGVLVVVAMGLAAITTMGNILTILAYALAGLFLIRFLGQGAARWSIFGMAAAAALFLTFVVPGGPILFLDTLPAMGYSVAPFGLIVVAAVLALLLWLADVILRHVEDPFRVGLLIIAGVYFFAFIEAIVFVQQRLGYI